MTVVDDPLANTGHYVGKGWFAPDERRTRKVASPRWTSPSFVA
jgi:hypothetical protein